MDIALPELGENIEEAEVLNVLVRVGDTVAQDQPVLELETDKATFELPSPGAGTVSAVHVVKGDTVRVGQKVLSLDAGAPPRDGASRTARSTARDASRRPSGPDERDAEDTGPREPREPAEDARDEDAENARGEARTRPARDDDADADRPSERDAEARDDATRRPREASRPRGRASSPARRREAESRERDVAATDERDNASAMRRLDTALEDGRDDRDRTARAETRDDRGDPGLRDDESDDERAGDDRARGRRAAEQDDGESSPGARDRGASVADAARRGGPGEDQVADEEVAAGPMARRLAREHGADLARIRGTGSGGRITPEDVQAFVRAQASAKRVAADAERADDEVERRPLSGIEKAAARHLARSWSDIPHVTHHDLADVTEMEEARVRYEAERGESAPKLTWTTLVVKAVVAALKRFPDFNSRLDLDRQELVRNRRVHVGIAVDTEHGLLVPVVRDADRMTTGKIAAEIASLAERARQRKLGRDDMKGAGITVTNLGGIGGVAFTPIINHPEVAILGVARGRDDVAWRDGAIVRRIVLPLSLSYDHRVIDGAAAARFVRYVAGLLEHPVRLLIES